MSRLENALSKLTQYEYIVTGNEVELRKKLQAANNAIAEFVSRFEKPELICPELVEYMQNKK